MWKYLIFLFFSSCTFVIQNPNAYIEGKIPTPSITQPTVPNAPILTSVSGNSQIVLSWPVQTDATSYNLYFGNSTGVLGSHVLGVSSPYTHNAANGTTVYFTLTAVNSVGESIPSTEVHATAGVIDNHNGTIYIATLNQTWPKCSQVDTTGKNMYNPALDDCSGGIMGTFQNCSIHDSSCAPAPLYILNGSGISGAWMTCNGATVGGRIWRVPRDNELKAFQTVYIMNQGIFSGITTDGYWSGNDDTTGFPGRVILYDGFESYPNRMWYNPVVCVSDGV